MTSAKLSSHHRFQVGGVLRRCIVIKSNFENISLVQKPLTHQLSSTFAILTSRTPSFKLRRGRTDILLYVHVQDWNPQTMRTHAWYYFANHITVICYRSHLLRTFHCCFHPTGDGHEIRAPDLFPYFFFRNILLGFLCATMFLHVDQLILGFTFMRCSSFRDARKMLKRFESVNKFNNMFVQPARITQDLSELRQMSRWILAKPSEARLELHYRLLNL